MGEGDLQQVVAATQELKEKQETPDAPEALACIPPLALSGGWVGGRAGGGGGGQQRRPPPLRQPRQQQRHKWRQQQRQRRACLLWCSL